MFRSAFSRFKFESRGGGGQKRKFHQSQRVDSNPIKNVPGSDLLERTVSFIKRWPISLIIPAGFAVAYFWPQEKNLPQTKREIVPTGASNPSLPPGGDVPLSTKILETGSQMAQSFAQLKGIHTVLNGIHFYNGDPARQVESWHLCSHLNDDFKQCLIYDGPGKEARLIGLEYIISERIFNQLPAEERALWHSHQYEVKSGVLVAPGVPELAERQMMKEIANSYGKTWHMWQVDRGDVLPVGGPRLMMSFTHDGQLKEDLLNHRDNSLHVSSAKLRDARSKIEISPRVQGADAWETGDAIQCQLQYV